VNKVSRHSFDFILTLNLFYLKLKKFDYQKSYLFEPSYLTTLFVLIKIMVN
jgi:hypothetical protein